MARILRDTPTVVLDVTQPEREQERHLDIFPKQIRQEWKLIRVGVGNRESQMTQACDAQNGNGVQGRRNHGGKGMCFCQRACLQSSTVPPHLEQFLPQDPDLEVSTCPPKAHALCHSAEHVRHKAVQTGLLSNMLDNTASRSKVAGPYRCSCTLRHLGQGPEPTNASVSPFRWSWVMLIFTNPLCNKHV